MNLDRNRLKETPSQTAGPYVHIGCTPNFLGIGGIFPADLGSAIVNGKTKGERITVTGRAIDGGGEALRDALIEIWQADAKGFHNHPSEPGADKNFTGWGRQPVNLETGEFRFETIKPGPVALADGRIQAPHITFWIVARGINTGLHTRMYFPEEEKANAACPVLSRTGSPKRRQTLIARRSGSAYSFDIRIQGENETVFFDI